MISGLFSKKEPNILVGESNFPLSESSRPPSSSASASSSFSFSESNGTGPNFPTNKYDLKLGSLSSTYSSIHAARSIHPSPDSGSTIGGADPSNYFMRISSKIPEKLLDQSNVHFPSLYGLERSSRDHNNSVNRIGNMVSASDLPTPSFKLSDKLSNFRMIIIQDAGIRRKQPLFDSASPFTVSHMKAPHKLNKKNFHSVNELALFMFGCYGIPMSESNMTTKIHFLPPLTNMGSSILITRLFSLDSSFELKPFTSTTHDTVSDWVPHPVIDSDEIPLYENTTRFGIGVVIPISSSIESVRDEITNNWTQISESFAIMQNQVVSSLKNQYIIHCRSMRPQNQNSQNVQSLKNQSESTAKFNFPLYSLQSDVELYYALASLLTKMISLVEISRLFIDLQHSNHALINWASTLALWKELKDGRAHQPLDNTLMNHTNMDPMSQNGLPLPSTPAYLSSQVKFLASLLSLFIPLRGKIFANDDDIFPHSTDSLEKIRIVIGTGNPVVSEKLIFILAGILGFEKFAQLYDSSEYLVAKEQSTRTNSVDTKGSTTEISTANVTAAEDTTLTNDYKSHRIPIPASNPENGTAFSRSIKTRNGSLFVDSSIAPDETMGKPSALRIPHSPSVATISASVQSQRIPVPSLNRTSSYASLQNLSTSYNANVPSSLGSHSSASSWRNNLGSFMERWKNSITPSPTSSQFSHPLTPTQKIDTPSPAAEYEEYPWYSKKPFNMMNSPTLSSSASITSNTTTFNKFSLKNNPNYKSYVAIDDGYELNRTCSGLIGSKYHKVVENISSEIATIMDGYFPCTTESDGEFSLVNVDEIDPLSEDNENFSYINQQKLPLLAGYITQFRPEFRLQSCPHKLLGEGVFVESMKNDFQNHKCKRSEVFFINLGMRKVTHLAMDNNETMSNGTNGSEQLLGKDLSKGQLKSNLTKHMQSGIKLHQEVLLTPSKPLNGEQINSDIGTSSDLSRVVDRMDTILEDIVRTVNEFFFKLNDIDLAGDGKEELERDCCEEIRQLIRKILQVGQEI